MQGGGDSFVWISFPTFLMKLLPTIWIDSSASPEVSLSHVIFMVKLQHF